MEKFGWKAKRESELYSLLNYPKNMEQPNIDYILKLARGEESIKLKLIKVLQYELPIEIEAYFENIKSNQWQQSAFHVHKIKHKIKFMYS